MKTAKATAVIVNFTCPDCEQGIMNPETFSYDWTGEDIARAKGKAKCDCGQTLKLGSIRVS